MCGRSHPGLSLRVSGAKQNNVVLICDTLVCNYTTIRPIKPASINIRVITVIFSTGVYLVYEVNHRSVNQVASGHFFRSVLFSQAILNLALWADALFDVACRIEPDNAIFFGDDFWLICKPIFKAALVALRILSALLFLMLAMHSDDHGDVSVEVPDGGKATKLETFEPAESGKKEHRNKTNDQQNRDEKTLKKTRKYEEHVDGLERALEHIENAVRNLLCDDNNTPDGTNDPVVHDENRLSKFVRLLSIRPDVNYGVVIRLSRIKDNSFQFVAEAISSKQVGTEALMHSLSFLGLILILIPPVVLGWALKLLEGDDAAKYVPELIIHVIIISCCIFILLPHSPVNHWKIKTHVPVVTRLKNLVHDPELSAITIFGIAANWYHILLFSFYCKDHELFIDALPQVDVFVEIVSATLRLWVVWIFKMRHGATFRKRNDTLTEVVLGILTACSLSVLIMDIQREEFSDNEHTLVHHLHMEWVESVLGVLAPLSVDFSLHGALLLYSVFYDYIKFSGEPGFVGDETDDVVMHVESIV